MELFSLEQNEIKIFPFSFSECSYDAYGDVAFQKSNSKNMDKLCAYFLHANNYPEYYLGMVKRVAICKCPETGKEGWFNGEKCLCVENPKTGSIVTVNSRIQNKLDSLGFIFIRWTRFPVHEWRMRDGTILQLSQNFVDKLLPEDRRYLKINR
jgi:hypothetical protein